MKTSAERWELQRQQLKNMRRRKPTLKPMPAEFKLDQSKITPESKHEQNKIKSDSIRKRYRKAEERFAKKPHVKPPLDHSASEECQDDFESMESPQEEHTPPSSVSPERPQHNSICIDTLHTIPSENSHSDHSENTLSLPSVADVVYKPNFIPAPPPENFNIHHSTELVYNQRPPVIQVPITIVYKEPFYSKPSDLPTYPTVFSGKEFKLPTSDTLKEFKTTFQQSRKIGLENTRIKNWSPALNPPTYQQVKEWSYTKDPPLSSQLDEPTMDNTFDFKLGVVKPQIDVTVDNDFIDYFSLEIHGK